MIIEKGLVGHVFLKIDLALAKYSIDLDSKMNLLAKAIKINNKIRHHMKILMKENQFRMYHLMIRFNSLAQVVKLVDTRI